VASGRLRIGYPVAGTYTLAAGQGSFSLSGQNATLSKSTVDSGGLSPTPESTGGTIVLDTRAGGAQSTQGSDVTTVAQYKAKYGTFAPYSTNGIVAENPIYNVTSEALAIGEVGSGIKSRRVNYNTSTDEHGSLLSWVPSSYAIAPVSGWYTSGKFWIPSGFQLGQGNPHWKTFFWNRVNNQNGRLYLMFYGNDYMAIRVDETGYNRAFTCPGVASTSPFSLRDRIVQWTVYFSPATETCRLWIKATGVTGGEAECTLTPGESYGTTMGSTYPLGGFQENGTCYTDAQAGRYLHTWDHVIWY
jgi:hypothetical protein